MCTWSVGHCSSPHLDLLWWAIWDISFRTQCQPNLGLSWARSMVLIATYRAYCLFNKYLLSACLCQTLTWSLGTSSEQMVTVPVFFKVFMPVGRQTLNKLHDIWLLAEPVYWLCACACMRMCVCMSHLFPMLEVSLRILLKEPYLTSAFLGTFNDITHSKHLAQSLAHGNHWEEDSSLKPLAGDPPSHTSLEPHVCFGLGSHGLTPPEHFLAALPRCFHGLLGSGAHRGVTWADWHSQVWPGDHEDQ